VTVTSETNVESYTESS